MFFSILAVAMALVGAPFLRTVVNRTKAAMAGRQGPPLLLPYRSLLRLLSKGAVYGDGTTWVFRAGPVVSLATAFGALCLVPFAGRPSLIHFDGDVILMAYLLGVGRYFTVLAAMDTGSSFEGMGANREAFFSALTEPSLLLGVAGLGAITGSLSLSGIYGGIGGAAFLGANLPAMIFILASFVIVYLTENSRIPVDDPTTHLELTMIHEVMVLDHCGVDLAFIEYGGALKLWTMGLLITGLVYPGGSGSLFLDVALSLLCLLGLQVALGLVESSMARLKMGRIPQFLAVGFVMSTLWIMWVVR
ncbi:respiratory chain complex I subunit 1 family protein [Dethiosulfovibrio salsuginis]|uniref:respiratory chain complex I subunit 1 family protein n=1 Tax=Dethiosulfovibrio salsuginis TaxID=561720 RepID=UPI0011788E2C|nr:NADH-quinone oxidoreductase subunit H [Dethiosulfovibrio salsuginis]